MKKYYGNYLGLCISNADPQQRGRVQVFVPQIMPTIKQWNTDLKNIRIKALGDNMQDGLSSDVINDLSKILPWAESASPIMGSSSPGTLTTSGAGNSQSSSGGIISGIVSGVKQFFNQSPVSSPSTSTSSTTPKETTSVSGTVASANTHQSSTAVKTDPEHPSYGNVANPTVPPAAATVQANTAISPGLAAGLAIIGEGETGFDSKEANKDQYNQVNNNANVRAGVKKGMSPEQAQKSYGDYGFYQNNDATEGGTVEKYCLGLGQDAQTANYWRRALTNDGGKGAFSAADQTQAMVYLFSTGRFAATKAKLDALDPKDPTFQQQVNQAMLAHKGTWFGIPRGIKDGAAAPGSSSSQITSGSKAVSSPAMVNKTDPHGPVATYSLNNTAKGVFSYPAPGALLWVFFIDGNPLFPVYFAANYGASEWKSAYKNSSPGTGMSTTPSANGTTSQGGVMNLNSAGGIHWSNTDSPSDQSQSQKSFMVFGHDGSNMHIAEGYHQIFSKFDRRDHVEGDRFQTTLGFEEKTVQGDYSQTISGDVYVKIGNISQPAVDAVKRIDEINNQIHTALAQSS